MNFKRDVGQKVTIADQPTEDDLQGLKKEGYAAVVNVRNDGEPDQPMGTAAEGRQVQALGMDYLHAGIGGAPFTEEKVSSINAFLDRHAQEKVLVHCRKGSRAAAMVLVQRALAEQWSPEEAIARGQAQGLDVEGNLRTMVEDYLRQHGSAR